MYTRNGVEHLSGRLKYAAVPSQITRIMIGHCGIDFLEGKGMLCE